MMKNAGQLLLATLRFRGLVVMHGVWQWSRFLFSQNVVRYCMECFSGMQLRFFVTCVYTVIAYIYRSGMYSEGRSHLRRGTGFGRSTSTRPVSIVPTQPHYM